MKIKQPLIVLPEKVGAPKEIIDISISTERDCEDKPIKSSLEVIQDNELQEEPETTTKAVSKSEPKEEIVISLKNGLLN